MNKGQTGETISLEVNTIGKGTMCSPLTGCYSTVFNFVCEIIVSLYT